MHFHILELGLFLLLFFEGCNHVSCIEPPRQRATVMPLEDDFDEERGKFSHRDSRIKQIVIEMCPKNNTVMSSYDASTSNISSQHEHQNNKNPNTSGYILNALLRKIFLNYNKEAIPLRPVEVHLDVLLLKVKNTVEKEGIFECVIALFIEWKDFRMTWDPKEYDNLTVLAFDSERVWLPDIAMTNSADHLYSISRDSRFVVRVSHTGLFKYVPTGTARTWCDLKLLTFPFDYQKCSLEFESWSLDSTIMTFDNNSHLLVDDGFASNQFFLCERRVVRYDHLYEFTGETFTRLKFDFKVRRKSTFYIINLIFPCATLSAIQLTVFLIPSTDTTADRIGFGTTNLLTLVVFQTIVTEEMPKTSDAVTALSKYIISLILISAVGIFESVMVERMFSDTSQVPPPKIVQILLKFVPIIGKKGKHYMKLRKRRPSMRKRSIKTVPTFATANVTFPITKLTSTDVENNDKRTLIHRRSSYINALERLGYHQNEMAQPSLNGNDEKTFLENEANNSNNGILNIQVKLTILNSDGKVLADNVVTTVPDTNFRQSIFSGKKTATVAQDDDDEEEELELARNNARIWASVALKIDFLAFVTCFLLAIIIPSMLFFPLLDFQHVCSDEHMLSSDVEGGQ